MEEKRFQEERHVCYRVRNEGEKKRTITRTCIGGRGRVQNLDANMTTKKIKYEDEEKHVCA